MKKKHKIPSICNSLELHVCHRCQKDLLLEKIDNAAVYKDVLNHFLVPYIKDKFGDNEFIFQYDLTLLLKKNSSGRRRYLFLIGQQIAQIQIFKKFMENPQEEILSIKS